MDIVEYKGWKRNVRLANDRVELIATLEVGPRVLHLAAPGGENVFKNFDEQMGSVGEDEWQIRGGHRLWFAPEDPVATYFPDNDPVEVEAIEGGVRLRPPPETPNGLQKEIDLALDASEPHVRVVHRLTNIGDRPLDLAPWGLSVMAPGGTAVVGLPPRGTHPEDLLPNQHLVLWPYTDLGDPRYAFGARSILLKQDAARGPTKLGLLNLEGWAAYAVAGCLFVKRFAADPAASYPDMGCNTELFTNEDMLEVESLGAMERLEPGLSVEHIEDWHVVADVPAVASPEDAERHVRPVVEKLR